MIAPAMQPKEAPTQPTEERSTVVCYHCNKAQEVGRKAMSATCKHCYKSLQLKDQVFTRYEARRVIETVGIVTIEKKGNVVADKIQCGGLIVRGKVRGAVTSRGPVLVGPDADLIGDVTAPTMAVGAGAVLEGRYVIGKTDPERRDNGHGGA
jgi:hypothetical protein